MVNFEAQAAAPAETVFAVYNAEEQKEIAYAPVTAAEDWKEIRYFVYVDENNAGKELCIPLLLKFGLTRIRNIRLLDCRNNGEKWQTDPYRV